MKRYIHHYEGKIKFNVDSARALHIYTSQIIIVTNAALPRGELFK